MDDSLALDIDEDLLATCSALGYTEDNQYYKGEECWECMKDLIRFLKHDGLTSCETRRQLGRVKILQKDLLPILVNFCDDEQLLDACIKLLVNLCLPAFLCMDSSYPGPKDVQANKIYLELNFYLIEYKEAFANNQVMNVIGQLLTSLCQKAPEDRSLDESNMVERILFLLRNLLHVPSAPNQEQRPESDINLHDELLWNMHVNGIDEILILISNSSHERQWLMMVLEIVFLMLKEQNASCLAMAGQQLSEAERQQEYRDFEVMAERELQQKKRKLKERSTRHSRFGGTFVMTSLKALDEKESLVYHKSLPGVSKHSLDSEKRRVKVNKLRVTAKPQSSLRVPAYKVREMLKNFCVTFLECSYNSLMRITKETIMRDLHLDNDQTYYLWALRFFMEFNRVHSFRVDLCRETLSVPTIDFVMSQLLTFSDSLRNYKNVSARPWSRRLHHAIQAYHQLLEFCQAMSVHEDPSMRENAEILQTNVLYSPEYRDTLVDLVRTYDPIKSDKEYLKDLVQLIHLYLKVIEGCRKQKKVVLVQKKQVRKKKKKRSGVPMAEDQIHEMWQTCESSVAESLAPESDLPMCDAPYDASSDIPLENQRDFALEKVAILLRENKVSECVATFRACREIWPEGGFGSAETNPEEELELLRDMFLSHRHVTVDEEGQENDEEDDQVAQERRPRRELEFEPENYIRRFANQKVVRSYCLLLADYRKNSVHLNHCIVKMLHCVAVKYDMAPFLYHISILRTMESILNDPGAGKMTELVHFAQFIVRNFFVMAKENPCLFAEALFWKTPFDVRGLQEGYDAFEARRALLKAKGKAVWTYEQEEELRDLFDRHKNTDDIIGCILSDLPSEPARTRRQISAQLIRMRLVTNRKQLHKKRRGGKPSSGNRPKGGLPWTEEEIRRLEDLYFEHGDDGDPVTIIASEFTTKNMDEIAAKLEELGFIEPTDIPQHNQDGGVSSSSDDSSGDDDDSHGQRPRGNNSKSGAPSQGRKTSTLKSFAQLGTLLKTVQDDGFADQLEWMAESLRDEGDDRAADDDWEALPIVPIHSGQIDAMDNEVFKKLLREVGLAEPANDQSYWRIPADTRPDELRHVADFLSGKLETASETLSPFSGVIPSVNSTPGLTLPGEGDGETSARRRATNAEEKRRVALKNLLSKRKRKPSESDNTIGEIQNNSSAEGQPKAKRKIILEDDSDEDDSPTGMENCKTGSDSRSGNEEEKEKTEQSFDDDLSESFTLSRPKLRKRNVLSDEEEEDDGHRTECMDEKDDDLNDLKTAKQPKPIPDDSSDSD